MMKRTNEGFATATRADSRSKRAAVSEVRYVHPTFASGCCLSKIAKPSSQTHFTGRNPLVMWMTDDRSRARIRTLLKRSQLGVDLQVT